MTRIDIFDEVSVDWKTNHNEPELWLDLSNGVAHRDETCPDYAEADVTARGTPVTNFCVCAKCKVDVPVR